MCADHTPGASACAVGASYSVQEPQQVLPSSRSPVPLQQPESASVLAAGTIFASEQDEPHAEPQEDLASAAMGIVFAEPQQLEEQAPLPASMKAAGRTMPGRTVQAIMLLGAEQALPQEATVLATFWTLEPQDEPHAESQDLETDAAGMVLASPPQAVSQEPQQDSFSTAAAGMVSTADEPHELAQVPVFFAAIAMMFWSFAARTSQELPHADAHEAASEKLKAGIIMG